MDRKRILIAVNNPPDIEKLRKMLAGAGYEVKVCEDGTKALSLSRDFRPHLILSELNLSKVDGHHFLREIKSQAATRMIPFVLMSRHRSVDERVHSISLGADDYITLPLDLREIMLRFEIILKEVETSESIPRSESKGFSGKLADMNLADLLQTLEIGGKSAAVRLESGDDSGVVFIRGGQVADAVLNELEPLPALFRMFTWSEGAFRVEMREVDQTSEFEETTEHLIEKGMLYRESWESLCQDLPSLDTAVTVSDSVKGAAFSPEERSMLNLLNGGTRMLDLVTQANYDDLQALQLVSELFKKGSLKEVARKPAEQNGLSQPGAESKGNSAGTYIDNLISSFINPKQQRLNVRKMERRRSDRRGRSDRRRNSRRWDDFIAEGRISLNKSELLMIREKLGSGKKR